MRIDRLQLKNFKCFDDLDIEFDKRVNLFVGINGSGKTAILKGIGAALGAVFQSRGFEEWRNIEDDERKTNGINTDPRSITQVTAHFEKHSWTRERVYSGRTTTKDAKWASEYGEGLLDAFAEKDNREIAPLIVNYSSQRLFNQGSLSDKQRFDPIKGRRNGYTLCLDEKSMIPTLTDWFRREEADANAKRNSGVPNNDFSLFNCKSGVSEMIRFFEDIHREHPIHIYYAEVWNDIVLYIGGLDALPLKYYSDGYRNLIYLVLDLIYRASQLNPWLDFNTLRIESKGIVIIDEVDLHLHPRWQGKAIEFLHWLFPNVQFFITTHSPSVISNFNPDSFGRLYVIGYIQTQNNLNSRVIRPLESNFFGKEVNDILGIMHATSRHARTQRKLDDLFLRIDNEESRESLQQALDELEAQLGHNDKDIQRALSLISWNEYRKAEGDAIHK